MKWVMLSIALGACVANRSNALVMRASFDLGCPKEQLQWYQLSDNRTVWGASGCSHRATYIYNEKSDQWIMNGSVETTAPAPAPQPGPPGAGSQQGVSP